MRNLTDAGILWSKPAAEIFGVEEVMLIQGIMASNPKLTLLQVNSLDWKRISGYFKLQPLNPDAISMLLQVLCAAAPIYHLEVVYLLRHYEKNDEVAAAFNAFSG